MGLLDRYLLRLLAPGLSLGVFVFLFALLLNELVRNLQLLVTRGASPAVVGQTLLLLVPGLLVVAIPSALLLAILLALNRLAAGSELVAMRAGGVSPWRLLRPIALASVAATGFSAFLMIEVVPETNRRFVDLRDEMLDARLTTEIRPRIFYDELLDGRVLLVGEMPSAGGDWEQVFLADTERPDDPTLFLARRGQLVTAPEERVAFLRLEDVEVHNARLSDPGRYRIQRAAEIRLPLEPEDFFGRETVSRRRDARAMSLPALADAFAETGAPLYQVEIHKKFSLPAACLVLGLIGLGLGLRPQAGAARSGAFAIAVLVVIAYHVPLSFGEELAASGDMSPWLAMWGPNLIVLAVAGTLLVLAARELDPLAPAFRVVGRLRNRVAARLESRRRHRSRRRRAVRGRRLLLDRYVGSLFSRYFVVALAALVGAQLIGRLTAVLADAFDHGIPLPEVARYLGLSVPEFTTEMLPLAALAATLITYGVLGRQRETTAFLAGGVSRARLAVPALLVGLAASAAGVAIHELAIPASGPAADDLGSRIRGVTLRSLDPLERHWGRSDGGVVFHYEGFDAGSEVVSGLSVFRLEPDGASLAGRVWAASAHWSPADRQWTGIGGFTRDSNSGISTAFAVAPVPGLPPPERLISEDQIPDHLRYRDLEDRIRVVEATGHETTELRVDLHTRASLPLAALVTVLIGVPFAFRPGNRGNAASAGIALAIGIVYLLAAPFFEFLGDARLLEPALAAWSPNLFFSLASAYLLFRSH